MRRRSSSSQRSSRPMLRWRVPVPAGCRAPPHLGCSPSRGQPVTVLARRRRHDRQAA